MPSPRCRASATARRRISARPTVSPPARAWALAPIRRSPTAPRHHTARACWLRPAPSRQQPPPHYCGAARHRVSVSRRGSSTAPYNTAGDLRCVPANRCATSVRCGRPASTTRCRCHRRRPTSRPAASARRPTGCRCRSPAAASCATAPALPCRYAAGTTATPTTSPSCRDTSCTTRLLPTLTASRSTCLPSTSPPTPTATAGRATSPSRPHHLPSSRLTSAPWATRP